MDFLTDWNSSDWYSLILGFCFGWIITELHIIKREIRKLGK